MSLSCDCECSHMTDTIIGPLSAFAAARAKAAALAQDAAIDSSIQDAAEPDTHSDEGLQAIVLSTSSESGEDEALTSEKQPVKLSSFDYVGQHISDNQLTLTLDATPGTEHHVTCSGIFTIEVKQGAVSVAGAYLTPASGQHVIYAPYTHALPTIIARFENTVVKLIAKDCNLSSMKTLSPLWNRVWPELIPHSLKLHHHSDEQATGLVIDDSTQTFLNRITSNRVWGAKRTPSVFVTGAKSSGKSTLCRIILNSFLTSPTVPADASVFWLDLDPGQPEFGCPGQLSLVHIRKPLFGPSFTHRCSDDSSFSIWSSHAVAASSPREDMDYFVQCAKSLFKSYTSARKTHKHAPLIINSPGWVTGSGADLIERLVDDITPSEIVILDSLEFPAGEILGMVRPQSSSGTVFTILPARQRGVASRPAAEMRTLQAMSYHHSDTADWNVIPLSKKLAYNDLFRLTYSAPESNLYGVMSYYNSIPQDKLASVLDWSPVFVVAIEDDKALKRKSEDSPSVEAFSLHHSQGVPYLTSSDAQSLSESRIDPEYSRCLGQAIIIRIDTERKEIYLSTPIPPEDIKGAHRVVLVRGNLGSADWALLEEPISKAASGAHPRLSGKIPANAFDLSESDDEDANGIDAATKRPVAFPYISVRKVDTALLGDSIWRPRHLPRRIG